MANSARRLDGIIVALDVDGVLLDSNRGGEGPWQTAVADRFGISPDEMDGAFFGRWWPDVVVGRIPIEEALGRAIEENGWPTSVEDLLDCWFSSDFVPMTEVIEAARGWSALGARLSLVTNQEHRRARYVRERLGSLLPLEQMVYSAAVGYVKRDPEFFIAATHALIDSDGHSAIVFMDDTLEHVMVAREAGWTAVHFEVGSWQTRMVVALEAATSTG